MGVDENINNNLNNQFDNFNYLPQELKLEDFGLGLIDYLNGFNFSIENENMIKRQVPIIYVSQELFAERKANWKEMRSENGQEVTRPFIAIRRTAVKKGSAPKKSTIPNKKNFKFVRVPIFDGTSKGYEVYKIPQPVWVDVEYEVRFVSHYLEDVDYFYNFMYNDAYSSIQGYLKVNGYPIASKLDDCSEQNEVDELTHERIYHVIAPITVFGKLVDPTEFEKINVIKKISLKITER